jgi:hypothetical protein
MIDHSRMKLGRSSIRRDDRTLRLARYFTGELPAPPPVADWSKGITSFGMMLNDKLGDCTIAGCGHAVQVWTANAYSESTIPDAAILSAYEKWDGYNPGDPDTDQGGVELDVLKNWRKQGLAGHHILGFVDPAVTNLEEIKQSIALFGGVYIGVSLPVTAQKQDVWDVAPGYLSGSNPDAEGGSWGGHCVYVCAYDQDGFTCITWGALKKMTTAFWRAYVDEAHTILGAGWIKANKAPSGFDVQQLRADLNAIS